MKFVVWGIGMNGTFAVDFVEITNIVAFIDTNVNFIGKQFFDRPIIDFNMYKEKYRDYFILITPKENEKIVELLEQEKIDSYMLLSEVIF